jgi:predicted kinase
MSGPIDDTGYRIGYAIAKDNLTVGRIVIADSVNPWPVTRDAWLAVARAAAADAVEIEIVCSDRDEHRRRVESRTSDIQGLQLPTWQEVVERDYQPWSRATVVIDTARGNVRDQLSALRAALVSLGAREESSRTLRIRES